MENFELINKNIENVDNLKEKLNEFFDNYNKLGILEDKWINKVDFLKGRITEDKLMDGVSAKSDVSVVEVQEILKQIKDERNQIEKEIIETGNKIDKIEQKNNNIALKNEDKVNSEILPKSTLEDVNKSKIKIAHDIRQLTRNLNEIGDIIAPDGYVYKKDFLIQTIVNLTGRNDEKIQQITNIYGLRDKVKEILILEELKK